MKKIFLSNNICLKVNIANSFWTRLRGLLGTKYLAKDEGLLIEPCNSVHMMGMKYAIDVIYLDKQYRVIKIVEVLRPWWGCSTCLNAASALEISAGMAKKYNFSVGQKFNLQ